jgi:hypothetical protein
MNEYFLIYNLAGDLTITGYTKSEIANILNGTNPTFPPEDCIGSDWDRANIDNIPEGKFALIKGILITPRPTKRMVWIGK